MQSPARRRNFEIVCEIEPPTSADMGIVREQVATLGHSCDAFLVPDSHLGRASVSSIAVAHEVARLGKRAIACLNARDRNLLGLQRDLLTAAACGVNELLFVYGDRPSRGERSDLTVQRMLREVNEANQPDAFRVGVAGDINRDFPEWKRSADFACTQLAFDPATVSRWSDATRFHGQLYAGVVVLASEKMARRLAETIPGLRVPDEVLDRLAADPLAGVDVAIDQVIELRDSGAVDGVHLVPALRYRETAVALERAGI